MQILHGTWDSKNFYIWIEYPDKNEISSKEKVLDLTQKLQFSTYYSEIDVMFPSKDNNPVFYPYTSANSISSFKIPVFKISFEDIFNVLSSREIDVIVSNSIVYWRNVLLLTLNLVKKKKAFYPILSNGVSWEVDKQLIDKIVELAPIDSMTSEYWNDKKMKELNVKNFISSVIDYIAKSNLTDEDYKILSEHALSDNSRYTLYFLVKPDEEGYELKIGLYDLRRNAIIPPSLSLLRKEFRNLLNDFFGDSLLDERYIHLISRTHFDKKERKKLIQALSLVPPKYKVFINTPTKVKPVIKIDKLDLFDKDKIINFDYKIALGDIEISPKEFKKLLEENKPYIEISGKLIEISPKDVKRINKILEKIKNKKITSLYIIKESLYGNIENNQVNEILKNIENQKFTLLDPPNLKIKLRPYQIKGFSWLRYITSLGFGACLADDMGLGKTIQTIATIVKAKESGEDISPSLIVCPTSVLRNWEEEIGNYAPSLSYEVIHGNRGRIRRKIDVYITTYNTLLMREDLSKTNWKFIVLDEAQNIKNAETKRSRIIRQLKGKYKIALTGTPIENSVNDLWSIMSFLNPGLLGSYKEFKKRFSTPIKKGDKKAKDTLKRIISPFILRRTKNDPNIIPDLPEKIEVNEYSHLTKEQAALYKAEVDELLSKIDDLKGAKRKTSILSTITKLKKIVDHPALIKLDNDFSLERSEKLKRSIEIIEEAIQEGDKVAVFTQFVEMGKILRYSLENLGYEALLFHGSLDKKDRDEIIQEFKSDENKKIIILSLRAGGVGINLTSANRVIHYDRWWNPAVENQATDRTHRIGQKKKVVVHKLITVGTIEEKIDEMLKLKSKLYHELIQSTEEALTNLSTDELKKVLELRS